MRPIQTIKELTIDGEGGNPLDLSNPANPDGKITETTVYDDNSRITSVSDDNGNVSTYTFDNLNRLLTMEYADSQITSYQYDKDSNLLSKTDNNGSVCEYTRDALNRVTQKIITPAAGIEGTTLQTFEYDGLSRLITATDNNANGTPDDSIVERKYDSLSRLVEEKQNGKVVSMNWREVSDLANCIYPNNRVIEYSQDKLGRLKTKNHRRRRTNPHRNL